MPDEIKPGNFGALSPDKGTIYLFNAWVNNLHSKTHKLLVGGQGSKGVAIGPKWKDKIEVLGPMNDVSDFYKKISFLIAPSVTEGFGICILEAMSYGRPVIVAEGAGAVELIEDG